MNKYFIFFFFSFLFTSSYSQKQKTDKVLTTKLEILAQKVRGTVGIYVRNIKTRTTVSINADSLFPTASMIKVPIMVALLDRVENGELKWDSSFVYRDSLAYDREEDMIAKLKDSARIPLSEIAMMMITTSDNTAALWCQYLAGTGMHINELLQQYGFQNTRVNSRTPGREQMRAVYGWGMTSPKEMAELVVKIREGKIVSPWASERMYRNMARIYWDGESLSEIPPYIHTASKQGAVDRSRSEVVYVNAPSSEYVFCVITKNQEDTSWTTENEGYVLLREVSKTLWNYFEPKDSWKSFPESLKKYH